MSIDPRIQGPGASQRAGTSKAEQPDPAAGAAFRALLERLHEKSRELDAASHALDDPQELGAAVEHARASVEDAVTLGSDLLEAYRAAQQRAAAATSTTQNDSKLRGAGPSGRSD